MNNVTSKIKLFTSSSSFEPLVFLGSLLVLSLILVLIAISYSKRKKRCKHRHHHREQTENISVQTESAEESGKNRIRKKKRRSAYPARSMNPTLAQTGGLPPLRNDDSSSSLN